MNKADLMNLSNLMENVRKMESATAQDKNAEEIKKIRQYCIDAVADHNDTLVKIADLVNENRDLWKNPWIYGSDTGFSHGKPYSLIGVNRFHCTDFTFNKGYFRIGYNLRLWVFNISGRKIYKGFKEWEEKRDELDTKNWRAETITLDNDGDKPWRYDLIEDTFHDCNGKSLPFTIENLRKYNFSIETWVLFKKKADKTRLRTQSIIDLFRKDMEKRIEDATKKLTELSNSSESSVYIKVQF